jgi:hypothetical protein
MDSGVLGVVTLFGVGQLVIEVDDGAAGDLADQVRGMDPAWVLARSGDVAGGCAQATAALSIGRAYGSERITSRAREFRSRLPVQTTEARELDDALAALYERNNG